MCASHAAPALQSTLALVRTQPLRAPHSRRRGMEIPGFTISPASRHLFGCRHWRCDSDPNAGGPQHPHRRRWYLQRPIRHRCSSRRPGVVAASHRTLRSHGPNPYAPEPRPRLSQSLPIIRIATPPDQWQPNPCRLPARHDGSRRAARHSSPHGSHRPPTLAVGSPQTQPLVASAPSFTAPLAATNRKRPVIGPALAIWRRSHPLYRRHSPRHRTMASRLYWRSPGRHNAGATPR